MASALETTSLQDRIAAKIDAQSASSMRIGSPQSTGIRFTDMGQVMEFAKMLAISDVGVRKHLRGNVGACLAVTVQAVEWEMSPFAVASKSYCVNDVISYEAQLLNAVILRRAPIVGRFAINYEGVGENRVCTVSVKMRDGGPDAVYVSPLFSRILPKNSPLWKTDPDQQLFYYSSRALCRRHFPDVLLGVYTPDEILDGIDAADAGVAATTLKPRDKAPKELGDRIDKLVHGVTIEADAGQPEADYVAASSDGRINGVIDKDGDTIDPETGEVISQAAIATTDKPAGDGEANQTQGAGGGSPAAEGASVHTDAKAAAVAETPTTAAADPNASLLADLVETGEARAQRGSIALRHFLDGLEPAERKMLPAATVEAWIKTARAKSATSDKGGR